MNLQNSQMNIGVSWLSERGKNFAIVSSCPRQLLTAGCIPEEPTGHSSEHKVSFDVPLENVQIIAFLANEYD